MKGYVSPYLKIDTKNRKIRFMGYELKLTKGEYSVFLTVLNGEYVSKNDIFQVVGDDVQSPSSIPVHICSINRKAKELCGSEIVKNRRKFGYYVEI